MKKLQKLDYYDLSKLLTLIQKDKRIDIKHLLNESKPLQKLERSIQKLERSIIREQFKRAELIPTEKLLNDIEFHNKPKK